MVAATKLQLPLSDVELAAINEHLSRLRPEQILAWAVVHLPNLYQTTAFGLTGLAATDMLSKFTNKMPPLIFLDTLYHFKETLKLKDRVAAKYGVELFVFKPAGVDTVGEFEERYGKRLWETNDVTYDYLVKVEPAQRAYRTLNVQAVITGRRASQGAARSTLQPLEVDSTGMLKLNPFFAWKFSSVKAYVDANNVPRNALLSQGFKSIGDWHSTAKSGEGDAGERAGRWKGKAKTECGLHKDYFKLKLQVQKKQREDALRAKDEARPVEPVIGQLSETRGVEGIEEDLRREIAVKA
ncbi:hypothetical protein BOTBODRAFT_570623 [Botryobasidium botryosum FD-172 SS1]|uniref:Phosphoadenosine phosphosulphate reductase domain-containing protein n=1 Tax=Botryobasidium botryosum (strain FD-172 SS1) TaxID=930990 RepID=A0A067M8R0_BOTB1|nr:hypothetical protein BOTBODRAFT_570623 [Botryobasidium botryosum FD-172 SS1]